MNSPKVPEAGSPVPTRKSDPIVDAGVREELARLNEQINLLREKNEKLEQQNRKNESKLDYLALHLNNFELSILERLAKPSSSTSPPASRLKKWAIAGTIIGSIIAASGAITAAVINSKTSAATRAQQAEVTRQVVANSQKSTNETFMAGIREGVQQTMLEMEQNKPIPPIKKPEALVKKKAPQPPKP